MKPYDGIEIWMYFIFAILAIAAIIALVAAFRIEKSEKAEDDAVIATGIRRKKYLAFGGFALSAGLIVVLAFLAQPISQNNYKNSIVNHIESQNVSVIEGFVDPSLPLLPESQSKFVIESDSGLLRCRANATGPQDDVVFVCQDTADENKDFTIPLSEVNNLEPISENDEFVEESDATEEAVEEEVSVDE